MRKRNDEYFTICGNPRISFLVAESNSNLRAASNLITRLRTFAQIYFLRRRILHSAFHGSAVPLNKRQEVPNVITETVRHNYDAIPKRNESQCYNHILIAEGKKRLNSFNCELLFVHFSGRDVAILFENTIICSMEERHNCIFSKNEINTGDDYLMNF